MDTKDQLTSQLDSVKNKIAELQNAIAELRSDEDVKMHCIALLQAYDAKDKISVQLLLQ